MLCGSATVHSCCAGIVAADIVVGPNGAVYGAALWSAHMEVCTVLPVLGDRPAVCGGGMVARAAAMADAALATAEAASAMKLCLLV